MKQNVFLWIVAICVFSLLLPALSHAEVVSDAEVRALLDKATPHPRLLMDSVLEEKVRQRIAAEDNAKMLFDIIRKDADEMINAPLPEYEKVGRRLWWVCRESLNRILTLSFVCRITGEDRYAVRAIQEMETAAAFSDWNPDHFLDVAEMTTAVAIGYDWLHDKLTTEQETVIRKAILEKGIQASYEGIPWWIQINNNWNQVCHGGMVLGALAIAEHEPDLAAKTIRRAVEGLPSAMKEYAPDGVYPEGPPYWQYGTTYNVLLIAALQSALNTDFGISESPGFLASGAFPLLMTGPTGDHFNFSDGGGHDGPYTVVYWFAQQTQDIGLTWYEHAWLEKVLRGEKSIRNNFPALVLLWWNGETPSVPTQPLHWHGDGLNPLAVHRSSWTNPKAVFLAIKAGTPYANHGHMDVGSFVLEADGVRWAIDLGAQDYGSLESRGMGVWNRSQKSDRWKVYRYHNRSHNTLLVDDIGQVVNASATITAFSDTPSFPHTIMDMSKVYAKQLAHAERGFALLPEGRVLIQDEIAAGDESTKVRWAMTTPAAITETNQGRATLSLNEKHLYLKALSPGNATIETFSTDPPNEWDAPNPDTRQVGFYVELEPQQATTITVLLTPGSVIDVGKDIPVVSALKEWAGK